MAVNPTIYSCGIHFLDNLSPMHLTMCNKMTCAFANHAVITCDQINRITKIADLSELTSFDKSAISI